MVDPLAGSLTASRRGFLLLGLGALLAGCAPSNTLTTLPGPAWKPRVLPPPEIEATAVKPDSTAGLTGMLVRTQWAGGQPATALMNRMLPVQCITVHHDGMEPFWASDHGSGAHRLEAIRRAHRDKGWGDIGYHFAIDREGRIWECRSLGWQGAHVKDQNEGNIGVVALGNFDRQSPAAPQLASLNKCVSWLMNRYRVPLKKVYTHQEWPTARTACPGMNLQRYMVTLRSSQQLG